jgi:lipid A 3-O-deacylase
MPVYNNAVAAACLLLLAAGMYPAHAAEKGEPAPVSPDGPDFKDGPIFKDGKAIISVVVENDIFAHTDQNYTNGLRLSWLSSEEATPQWVQSASNNLFPFIGNGRKRIGISLGQSIYTPEDLKRRDLIRDDRPYAGWLYTSIGVVSDTGSRLDNVMLSVGVVGPYSLAERTQTFVHRVIDSQKPLGWDNQIETEPGVVLTMERKWRRLYEYSPFGAGFDITPHAGFNLGNVNTDASLGATVRLGYDLPADYGPPRIRPSLPGSDFFVPTRTLGGYLFAGVEARAVARNIFLDGNTFSDSASIDKRLLVGGLQAGVALTYQTTRLSYTHVYRTKEFKGQQSPSQFGAITLSYRF